MDWKTPIGELASLPLEGPDAPARALMRLAACVRRGDEVPQEVLLLVGKAAEDWIGANAKRKLEHAFGVSAATRKLLDRHRKEFRKWVLCRTVQELRTLFGLTHFQALEAVGIAYSVNPDTLRGYWENYESRTELEESVQAILWLGEDYADRYRRLCMRSFTAACFQQCLPSVARWLSDPKK